VTRVYISVGSNEQAGFHVAKALDEMSSRFAPLDISPVYESVAVGFEGDNFLNLVVGFDTSLTLDELDQELDRIEQKCGRVRGQHRFSSRTMDLDLLLYGDLVRHDKKWDIPRREITEYAFVLKPLAELAPAQLHPELQVSYSHLWESGDFSDQDLWEVNI